jgi:putative membrane protein
MRLLPPALALVALTFTPAARADDAAPTDAQIFGVLDAANSGEITAGKAAQQKATSKDVKKFAEEMVKAHSAMDADGKKLATKLKITPADSAMSTDLKQGGEAAMSKMEGLSGAAYDQAYVEAQVADHEKVLTAIDKTLIPNAKDKQLRAMLHKARSKVAEHLKHAKHLEEKVQKSASNE